MTPIEEGVWPCGGAVAYATSVWAAFEKLVVQGTTRPCWWTQTNIPALRGRDNADALVLTRTGWRPWAEAGRSYVVSVFSIGAREAERALARFTVRLLAA